MSSQSMRKVQLVETFPGAQVREAYRYVRQEIIANEEAHEYKIVNHPLEIKATGNGAEKILVGAAELLVKVFS
eukprot:scaffold7034_cov31-Tisochrysis_lutea.AAC.2